MYCHIFVNHSVHFASPTPHAQFYGPIKPARPLIVTAFYTTMVVKSYCLETQTDTHVGPIALPGLLNCLVFNRLSHEPLITDRFRGPRKAIGPVCVCVYVCLNEIIFDLDIWHAGSS